MHFEPSPVLEVGELTSRVDPDVPQHVGQKLHSRDQPVPVRVGPLQQVLPVVVKLLTVGLRQIHPLPRLGPRTAADSQEELALSLLQLPLL